MNPAPQNRGNTSLRVAALCAAFAPLAFAQTTAPTSSPEEQDVVILSPFVVDTGTDTGYLASETLAGMRLKSDLKDVGAAMNVLTKDFLNAVSAFDMNDALQYLPNMQYHSFHQDDVNNASQWFAAPYISRGVRGTTIQVDFFNHGSLPIDRYNTEQMTFLRGPNAILFGIGSPSGLIAATSKRPQLSRDAYSLRTMVGSYDTWRVELDANQVLTEGRLAVRLNAIFQDRGGYLKPTYNRRNAMTAAVTYRPFDRTSITAFVEAGEWNRNHVFSNITYDAYTPWVLAGRPTINWMTGTGQTSPGKGNYSTAPGSGLGRFSNISLLTYVEGSNLPIMDWRGMARGQLWSEAVVRGAPGSGQIIAADANALAAMSFTKDNAITDLATNVFGDQHRNFMDYDRQSIFVEQNIARGLDLELAWNRHFQGYLFQHFGGNNTAIWVDPNELLPDGSPNPYVGMPYIETVGVGTFGVMKNYSNRLEFDNYRATLSYELDCDETKVFRSIGLGRYRFAALAERNEVDDKVVVGRTVNVTPLPGTPTPNTLNRAESWLNRRYYLQPGENNYRLLGPSRFYQATTPGAVQNGPLTIEEVAAGEAPRYNIARTESVVAAVQGAWWQFGDGSHHISALYGVRKDERRTNSQSFTRAPNGVYPTSPREFEGLEEAGTWGTWSRVEPTTRSYNITVRPVSFLRLFYNYSDIFSATPAQFPDVFGNRLRDSFGETEDYGVKLSLFSERVYLNVTKYETGIVDQALDNTIAVRTPINDIYNAIGRTDLVLERPFS